MTGLPQYKPSPAFQASIQNLNKGLQQAGELAARPITAQAALAEVTLPLINLLAQYVQLSQADTSGYFLGVCNFLYESQKQLNNDNIILAVDPELAEEVFGVVEASRGTIQQTRNYIRKISEYLKANKPEKYDGDDEELKVKSEANLEMWQGLREDGLRVLSLLTESDEDLSAMADNINSAIYEPDEEGDEGEEEGEEEDEGEEEGEDEVALPSDEPYESVIGD